MIENVNHSEERVKTQVKAELKKLQDDKKEAQEVTTIHDLLNYAIKNKDRSTALLIELLYREKKAIQLTDGIDVLEVYYNPKHRERLNVMIGEFVYSGKSIYNNLI